MYKLLFSIISTSEYSYNREKVVYESEMKVPRKVLFLLQLLVKKYFYSKYFVAGNFVLTHSSSTAARGLGKNC